MFPIDVMNAVFDYDPKSGRLTWKERPEWLSRDGWMSEQSRKSFNTQFAGREALRHLDKDGYKGGTVLGRYVRAHRVAYAMHNGCWPSQTVDHVNRDKTDNRAENLRDVSRSVQQKNRGVPANSSSGIVGVHWNKARGKWSVKVNAKGERQYMGLYDTLDEVRAVLNA